jgi:glycosyltransferase involved in cell wall biosynthesis
MTADLRHESVTPSQGSAPRLSIGLPVYNGEPFLSEALDALLAQTFQDFELIISDNASSDSTAEICQEYARRDPRIRYVRQAVNIGAAGNHNAVITLSRGELFKWASDDDLYAPQLLERCVEVLDANPEVVLAHAWDAFIDETGATTEVVPYRLDTADARAWVRLRSLLRVSGGNDIYGVIRASALPRNGFHGSYHNADRTLVAMLALEGPFLQVPEVMYFRRDHPGRTERRADGPRSRAAILDPRRANKWRHPLPRLYAEYVWGYLSAIARAPLSPGERMRCYREIVWWMLGRLRSDGSERLLENSPDPAVQARARQTIEAKHGSRISRLWHKEKTP